MFRLGALVWCLTFAAGPVVAQEDSPEAGKRTPDLAVGDPAPSLTISKWVKGSPVTSFEKGKVYVVEFWATWCGPCIRGMPHLTEVQKEYEKKGLTVIGVSCPDPRGNTLDKVEAMVKEKGDVMGYTVAWDTERQTNEAWMRAANQNGIPCCFVVDPNGKIAYIGHPMWLDIPLPAICGGTWDLEKGPARVAAAEKQFSEINAAMRSDPKEALTQFDAFAGEYPKVADQFESMRFSLLLECGKFDRASQIGNGIVKKAIHTKNVMNLNEVAWNIVDPEKSWEKRDLDLAMKAAKNANDLSDGKDAAILDTLARVYFLQGEIEKAIDLQEKAVAESPPNLRSQLEKALEEYRKAAGK